MKAEHIFLTIAASLVIVAVTCEATYYYHDISRSSSEKGCVNCIKGDRGPRGYTGRPGSRGERGPPGYPGMNGRPGYSAKQGSKGEKGDPGSPVYVKGIKGCKGEQGSRGPSGLPGVEGPPGAKGTPGRKGPPGLTGAKGGPGVRGATGKPGLPGKQGLKGDAGFLGSEGPKGDRGETGMKGERGSPGLPGPVISQGERGEKGEQGSTFGGGNTYIRWGRNTCEEAEIVYNGVAVARQGSNPICLPEYDRSNDNISFRNVPPVFDFDIDDRENITTKSQELTPVGVRNDRFITSTLRCALCFLPNLPAPTLIVGTPICPKIGTWRREYYGQLVTGSVSGGDFICADLAKVTKPNSSGESFAYLFSSVSADCQGASTGCPSEERFDEIPCALCTRIG